MPEAKWGLKGQMIQIQIDPKTGIFELKETLSLYLEGLPAKKIRLRSPNHSFLKDKYSIARYNLIENTIIDLGIKERGGKRR